MIDRLAEVDIAEGRLAQVRPHLVDAMARSISDLDIRVLRQLVGQRRSDGLLNHVDLSALERAGIAIDARDNNEIYVVHLWRHVVVLVGLEVDFLALAPVAKDEGTAANRLEILVFARTLDAHFFRNVLPDVLWQDDKPAKNIGKKRRIRPRRWKRMS